MLEWGLDKSVKVKLPESHETRFPRGACPSKGYLEVEQGSVGGLRCNCERWSVKGLRPVCVWRKSSIGVNGAPIVKEPPMSRQKNQVGSSIKKKDTVKKRGLHQGAGAGIFAKKSRMRNEDRQPIKGSKGKGKKNQQNSRIKRSAKKPRNNWEIPRG